MWTPGGGPLAIRGCFVDAELLNKRKSRLSAVFWAMWTQKRARKEPDWPVNVRAHPTHLVWSRREVSLLHV